MPGRLSDEEQGFLDAFFARHPEAKASFDRRWAKDQQRQDAFDAMDLPELRQAAISALTSAAAALTDSDRSITTPSDDWLAENRQALAEHFRAMVENIDRSTGGLNMAKWFDFFAVEEPGQEELQILSYEAVAIYDEYLRRKSS